MIHDVPQLAQLEQMEKKILSSFPDWTQVKVDYVTAYQNAFTKKELKAPARIPMQNMTFAAGPNNGSS